MPSLELVDRHPMLRLIIFASLMALLVPASDAAQQSPPAEDEIPFSLAVRGGVSLGSYEAGLNWAMVRYMKALRHNSIARNYPYAELRSVSGASAGSINSLLTAVTWCGDESQADRNSLSSNRLTANLFENSWMGVGFDQLLPEPVDSKTLYRPDDGVLSRNAFNTAINGLKQILVDGKFRPGCRVPVGILVTRVEPVTMVVAGIEVHNQRFMVPLEFFTDSSGRAGFTMCEIDERDPALGNTLLLPGKQDVGRKCPYLIETNDVVDAIEASSAFPLAFGRKQLRFCEHIDPKTDQPTIGQSNCPRGYRETMADFVDGGLFDNIPLGAAKALGEPTAHATRTGSARHYNYIYLDPTIRRPTTTKSEKKQKADKTTPKELEPLERTFGLRSQGGFLLGAYETSRDYELYNVLRGGEWDSQVPGFADKLIDIIVRRYPGTRPQISLPSTRALVSSSCQRLFDRRLNLQRPGDRSDAVSCIASHAVVLERLHAGQPVAGYRSYSRKQLLHLRNTLIAWIAQTARLAGEPQLALRVEDTRVDPLNDRRILLAKRFSPLTGEMIFSFGAFSDPDFRQYDYYAGVYDAAWNMANYLCERQPDAATCLAHRMQSIYRALAINKNVRANTVFMYILQREFADDYASSPRWAWARDHAPRQPDTNMRTIADCLFGEVLPREEWPYESPKFGEFVSRLTNKPYDRTHSSNFLKRIFKLKDSDQLSWYYPLTMRASNRLLLLEQRESAARGSNRAINAAIAMGAFVAHSYVREEEFTLNHSTAPDNSWQAWLPYEIAVDARNGGIDVSWEPSINLGNKGMALAAKVTPVQFNRFGSNEIWFSHADLFLSYRRGGIFSSFGAGPSMTYTWAEWPGYRRTSVGASAYVGLVQDKLRITVGTLSSSGNSFPGDNYYLNFGITDIPGFVYWITKAAQ